MNRLTFPACFFCAAALMVALAPQPAKAEGTQQNSPSARGPRSIAVWIDRDLTPPPPTDPQALAELLEREGFHVTRLSTADLTSNDRMDPRRFNVLVLPYSEVYPAAGGAALETFLASGGAYVALGGCGPTAPLYRSGDGWLRADAVGKTAWADTGTEAWDSNRRGDETGLAVAATEEGALFSTAEVAAYAYAGRKLPPLPPTASVLCFDARGDGRTPFLCLELRERDGSRWKHVLPLSEQWQKRRLPLTTVASYASKQRGTKGDYLHADRAESLWFGFTRAMVGPGAHEFRIRGLRFAESPVPPDEIAASPSHNPNHVLAARFFGKDLVSVGEAADLSCGPRAARTSGRLGVTSGVMPVHFPLSADQAATVTACPLTPLPTAGTRLVPLLEVVRDDTAERSVVAAMVMNYSGPYSGSVRAAIGVSGVDLLAGVIPGMREGTVDLCRFLCEGIVWGDPRLECRPVGQDVRLSVTCPLLSRAEGPAVVASHGALVSGQAREERSASVTLKAHGTAQLSLGEFPASAADWRDWSVSARWCPSTSQRASSLRNRTPTPSAAPLPRRTPTPGSPATRRTNRQHSATPNGLWRERRTCTARSWRASCTPTPSPPTSSSGRSTPSSCAPTSSRQCAATRRTGGRTAPGAVR
ncbi:MAG: hypothetical protein COZ06_33275 [Armatimonadetes bacterium CG_4_10_14_3_um_filter_66_18]|nr:MAG: hypothetical protein COZ57_12595 [Armatimonadetes bacterium CG_4_8_14_3_um_filter_66_20]PIY37283.1 MAG: hypothetical protein COZ06_33275 [Armatimonadetes bacterium CG_4_10_14_3_um_filter_66_18]PIZ33210.1 MAG: hypothetical protein COY42_30395 [Armatimonadetes bacterium CG_4_10_14_0_8_um_filter_66_14]PJB63340.1 MAG: hypothetical protein CO096_22590 [Armatimonadetes bacterium CG_4_9_14_3_um_filter_66_14]